MGYQESLLKFKNKKELNKQMLHHNNFKKSQNSNDISFLSVLAVVEVNKSFTNIYGKRFKEKESFIMIGGERSFQKNLGGISEALIMERVKKVIPIEEVSENLETNFECVERFVDLTIWNDCTAIKRKRIRCICLSFFI